MPKKLTKTRGSRPLHRSGSEQVLEWIKTEITAGMVLVPINECDTMWNRAHQRALNIVELYRRGEGLFQMTAPNSVISRECVHGIVHDGIL